MHSALARGVALLGLVTLVPAAAAQAPRFEYCLVCHGSHAGGNVSIGAPNLTILSRGQLRAQLRAFQLGYRGQAAGDHAGRSMSAAVRTLDSDAALAAAVEYIAGFPEQLATPSLDAGGSGGAAPRLASGGHGAPAAAPSKEAAAAAAPAPDAQRGAALYRSCATCHGARGEGSQTLGAPRLAGQNDWYLLKQLRDYRSGARGAAAGDRQGTIMRSASSLITDDGAARDLVAYINTLAAPRPVSASAPSAAPAPVTEPPGAAPATAQESETMRLTSTAAAVGTATLLSTAALAQDIVRHPLPNNSSFPIAEAVTVPAGMQLTFHSGLLPAPADPEADPSSRAFLGDTYTQTLSVLERLQAALQKKNMRLGDIVKMNVYLVGDPELDGRMDFAGFMRAYSQFFGTVEQPALPARAAVQVAGLARGAMVEIEVVLARRGG